MSLAKLTRLDPESLRDNPRATLASWQRYSAIVEAAYRRHPTPYVYSPPTMAATTVCSRIRDAIRGCLAFKYDSPIPHPDLHQWFSEVIFKVSANTLVIGPPSTTTPGILHVPNGDPMPLAYSALTLTQILAFMELLSAGLIIGPVIITQPPDLSLLPARDNVEIIPKPDGSIALL